MPALTRKCHSSSEPSLPTRDRFIELSERYAAFSRDAGVELIPYRDPALPYFSSLGDREKREVLANLETAVGICASASREGMTMKDSRGLVWQAIRAFGFRPTSDLFQYIDDDLVLEVHTREGRQIFRNFNFYQFCSYSLEELHCLSWADLYIREPQESVDQIHALAGRVFEGKINSTQPAGIVPHYVTEAISPKAMRLFLQLRFVSTLFHDGQPAASVVLTDCRFA